MIKKLLFKVSSIVMVYLEILLLKIVSQSASPQIFILGLPRSGTTLIYQYITHRLDVSYFTRGVTSFPGSPCIVSFLQTKLFGHYESDFKSVYGKVKGPNAPREAGNFWNKYFDIDAYVETYKQNPKDMEKMVSTISCLQKMLGDKPFVNKNIKHMLRVSRLKSVFPNAVFLVIERDIEQVALSVLRARHDTVNNASEWWSIKPANFEKLKNLDLPSQVSGQLFSVKDRLTNDLLGLDDRVIRVEYEKFCENPETVIEAIRNKIKVGIKNRAVSSFKASCKTAETDEERGLLEKLIEK